MKPLSLPCLNYRVLGPSVILPVAFGTQSSAVLLSLGFWTLSSYIATSSFGNRTQ
jgi:hypothetical protein